MSSKQVNWETGRWESGKDSSENAEIIISADWAPIRDFSDIILNEPEAIYGDLLPVLRSADLRITNLECPLLDKGDAIWKSGSTLKGMNNHINGLTAVPIEAVSMANNHVFDYGNDAFIGTSNLLKSNNIASFGAGQTIEEAEKPHVVEIKGYKIGFINFSEGEDLTAAGDDAGVFGWEVDRVCELIAELKSKVNAVIVICHGGLEYIPFPPPYIALAFQRVADAGADLVIGHHPHVPQGVQIYDGVPICYSLGNFVFFQKTNLKYRKIGYLVKAIVNNEGLSGIDVIPYEILSDRLALIKGDNYKEFMKKMDDISRPLNDFDDIIAAWNGFLKYYGIDGFKNEIAQIMNKLDGKLHKGAAMFRNRMTTQQHRHHLTDLMTRIMDGKLNDAPEWAVDIIDQWFTEEIKSGSENGA